jgi:transposase
MIFVGIDWAEQHHDACVVTGDGRVLDRFRIDDNVAGVGQLHDRLAVHVDEPKQVVIGLEIDRGLLVTALAAAGYLLYAINPMSVDRYRDRHTTSGGKSDAGDAKILADLVRTDRHNHRPVAGDSELVEAIKVLARTHQNLIWTRSRHTNQLRSALREFYPAALTAFPELHHRDALAILSIAPDPERGRRLSTAKIRAALERAGRRRYLDRRAAEIRDALRSDQLQAPPLVTDAFATTVTALTGLLTAVTAQIDELEDRLEDRFDQHPDADLIRSLPGLSVVLGARVLAEFGDDPNRYTDAKARANYAGSSPITIASGKRSVAVARHARNRRLADATWQWALCSLTASPGARAYYDAHNPDPEHTARHARRKLANKLVKTLHGVLRYRRPYDEHQAWQHWHHNGHATHDAA